MKIWLLLFILVYLIDYMILRYSSNTAVSTKENGFSRNKHSVKINYLKI